jgi:hypothetical protein
MLLTWMRCKATYTDREQYVCSLALRVSHHRLIGVGSLRASEGQKIPVRPFFSWWWLACAEIVVAPTYRTVLVADGGDLGVDNISQWP